MYDHATDNTILADCPECFTFPFGRNSFKLNTPGGWIFSGGGSPLLRNSFGGVPPIVLQGLRAKPGTSIST